jgi:hypothetical protein
VRGPAVATPNSPAGLFTNPFKSQPARATEPPAIKSSSRPAPLAVAGDRLNG